MRLLVTGGAGFIGSAVVRHAIHASDDQVLVIDKLTYAGNLENLASVADHSRYAFVHADIADVSKMSGIMDAFQPDIVMHLAAESHVDRSIDGPGEFVHSNVVGTFALLQAALGYWRGLPPRKKDRFRFHHISTDEVFGALGADGHFSETTPYNPTSPYAASKAASDHFVRAWQHTYGLPTLVSNCSNNYGPFQFPEKLIPLAIINAIEGVPLPVYGTGANVRDWLYVDDHAQALLRVATAGEVGGTYCIGGRSEKTTLEVVRAICGLMDECAPAANGAAYDALIKFVEDRPGHDFRYAIDPSRVVQDLGWTPSETFETGLRKTVNWYLANPTWWKRIRTGVYRGERVGKGG